MQKLIVYVPFGCIEIEYMFTTLIFVIC